jgi:hypothetical protein
MPLMPTRPPVIDSISKFAKQKQSTPINAPPPSLLTTIVSPPVQQPPPPPPSRPPSTPSVPDAVIARCHSCGNRCQVIVSSFQWNSLRFSILNSIGL